MRFLTIFLALMFLSLCVRGEVLADRRVLNSYGEFENSYNYESLYKNEVISFCNASGVRPIGGMPFKVHVGGAFKALELDARHAIDQSCRLAALI